MHILEGPATTVSSSSCKTKESRSFKEFGKHHPEKRKVISMVKVAAVNDALVAPIRRRKSLSKSSHSRDRRSEHSRAIQSALDISAAPTSVVKNNTPNDTFFGDTSFFDQVFPSSKHVQTKTEQSKEKPKKSKKREEPINFFDMDSNDVFPLQDMPVAPTKVVKQKEARDMSSSPKERRRKSKHGEETSATTTKDKCARSRSRSCQRRSRSKSRAASVRRLDKSSHHTSSKKTESDSRSRSKSRGRSGSKTPSSKRNVSSSRERKSRSKSRETGSETADTERPLRRMLKQPSTRKISTPTTHYRRKRSSSKEVKRSQSRSSIQEAMILAFAEAEDTEHARNTPPSPADSPTVSSLLEQKRAALTRRRMERASSKMPVDGPPVPPVRSPEKKSPSTRSRKSRSDSVTRRKALSKRNSLGDTTSTHTSTTAPISFSSTDTVTETTKMSITPLPRRQLSLPVSSRTPNFSKQVSFSNRSQHKTSTTVAVSAVTGELATKTPSQRPRPGLARASGSGGSGRQADARIDGLLQKLRDPSSRNIFTQSKPVSAFADDGALEMPQKKGGMMARLSRKSLLAGVRLDG